jgi:hypothetical protein
VLLLLLLPLLLLHCIAFADKSQRCSFVAASLAASDSERAERCAQTQSKARGEGSRSKE